MQHSPYEAEVDQASPAEWSESLRRFADANLYQTWAYGDARWGAGRISRLRLKRDGRVVAMAQTAVIQPFGLKFGMAQLRWGPVLCADGDQNELEQVAQACADALHDEYVTRRRLGLRLLLPCWESAVRTRLQAPFRARFSVQPFELGESYRTMMVDLRPELASVRKQLDQKWRNQLNRAERNGLVVNESDGADALDTFVPLYVDMVRRKSIAPSNMDEFRRVQQMLAPPDRMHVMICEENGQPVAGLVASGHGHRGIYLLGATNEQGMKCKGAYLLQWRMMERLKSRGIEFYDLGGVNPDTNPGVFHFKKGFGGVDVTYPEPLVAWGSSASAIAFRAHQFGRRLKMRRAERSTQPTTSG